MTFGFKTYSMPFTDQIHSFPATARIENRHATLTSGASGSNETTRPAKRGAPALSEPSFAARMIVALVFMFSASPSIVLAVVGFYFYAAARIELKGFPNEKHHHRGDVRGGTRYGWMRRYADISEQDAA